MTRITQGSRCCVNPGLSDTTPLGLQSRHLASGAFVVKIWHALVGAHILDGRAFGLCALRWGEFVRRAGVLRADAFVLRPLPLPDAAIVPRREGGDAGSTGAGEAGPVIAAESVRAFHAGGV